MQRILASKVKKSAFNKKKKRKKSHQAHILQLEHYIHSKFLKSSPTFDLKWIQLKLQFIEMVAVFMSVVHIDAISDLVTKILAIFKMW